MKEHASVCKYDDVQMSVAGWCRGVTMNDAPCLEHFSRYRTRILNGHGRVEHVARRRDQFDRRNQLHWVSNMKSRIVFITQ